MDKAHDGAKISIDEKLTTDSQINDDVIVAHDGAKNGPRVTSTILFSHIV